MIVNVKTILDDYLSVQYGVSNRCHTTPVVLRFGPAPLRSRVIHYLQGRFYP